MYTKFALGAAIALSIAAPAYAADSKECPHHPCPMMSGSGSSSTHEMHKDMPHGDHAMEGKKAAATEHTAKGKVVKQSGNSITLAHDPVPSIKWPAMTMAFTLASPDITKGVAPGDSVTFRFAQRGKDYVVTHLEKTGS